MQFPTARNRATPVVDRVICRSPRLRKQSNGFKHSWLQNEPSKKRKITAVQIRSDTGEAGPIPISTLQECGIACGVAPGELTAEALLQAPQENLQEGDHE